MTKKGTVYVSKFGQSYISASYIVGEKNYEPLPNEIVLFSATIDNADNLIYALSKKASEGAYERGLKINDF